MVQWGETGPICFIAVIEFQPLTPHDGHKLLSDEFRNDKSACERRM